ncbi:hypothetical protein M2326_002120 [Flavobacterium sp. 7A]|nr:hypothetical protein [Flavobacterium sp. 7A]
MVFCNTGYHFLSRVILVFWVLLYSLLIKKNIRLVYFRFVIFINSILFILGIDKSVDTVLGHGFCSNFKY